MKTRTAPEPTQAGHGAFVERDCLLCGSRKWTVHPAFLGGDMPEWCVVTCGACGFGAVDPIPGDDEWALYYPETYEPHQVRECRSAGLLGWKRLVANCVATGNGRRLLDNGAGLQNRLVERLIGKRLVLPFGSSRLLDIGCGADRYLPHMQQLGWKVEGVDRSSAVADRMRQTYGITVHVSAVPGCGIPDGPFDLVTMWEVLEHLSDPRGALERVRELLGADGRLMLSVPNSASWAAATFGSAWVGWDLPRHLSHFSERTLRLLLAQCGLSVVRTWTVAHPAWVRRSSVGDWRYRRKLTSSFAARRAARNGNGDSLVAVAKVDATNAS